jgi:hypothetical protein
LELYRNCKCIISHRNNSFEYGLKGKIKLVSMSLGNV